MGALKERAELVHKTLSSFEGYKVNKVQGAMYVFPQVVIPPKAIEAAKAKGLPADVFYASELLESTGKQANQCRKIMIQFKITSLLFISFRYLHCCWQWFWSEARYISLSQHHFAPDRCIEGHDEQIPKIPF